MPQDDDALMEAALAQAASARFSATPNPAVGCVIARAGRVIGRGFTQAPGGPHAEVMALRDCSANGESPSGATVYVTLEPCAHFGRTPPCANALVDARVARVVAALADPFPEVSGRGFDILRQAGIAVTVGPGAALAREHHAGFLGRVVTGRPWVRLKVAASIDGRTAMASGESQWVTGAAARADVQQWRALSCAMVTGIGTILADQPRLDVRIDTGTSPARQPMLAILDGRARLPADGPWMRADRAVLQVTGEDTVGREQHRDGVQGSGSPELVGLPRSNDGLSLDALLLELGRRQCNEVLVEAGPRLIGSFVAAELWDELILYLAPKLLGSDARPLAQLPLAHMADAVALDIRETVTIGEDLRLRIRPAQPA